MRARRSPAQGAAAACQLGCAGARHQVHSKLKISELELSKP
jgi:hypothetical protein